MYLSTAEPIDMAKKKAAGAEKPKQEILLVYKADRARAADVREWLEALADHVGAPLTVTVDMALKAFGEKHKFRPMPKRVGK